MQAKHGLLGDGLSQRPGLSHFSEGNPNAICLPTLIALPIAETPRHLQLNHYQDKANGLRKKVPLVLPAGNLSYEPLREDYVTSIAEDRHGLLYLGYRVRGYEIRRPLTDRVAFLSQKEPGDEFPYVSSVLPLRDGTTILANYGEGLTQAENSPTFVPTDDEKKEAALWRGWKSFDPPAIGVAFPRPAPPSTVAQLASLTASIKATKRALEPGSGYYEMDDWRTWGDWVGRYGSRYGMLCASGAPLNHYMVNDPSYDVKGFMGPNFAPNSLRHWIHWLQTNNPRVLYNPLTGYRREAEWDDNGEVMSMSIEGPDVWTKVIVPAGTHRLSTYYFNKDGHTGNNRMRDYLLELKKGDAPNVETAESLPTQSSARVRDFWGGVYKRFVVQGPGTFWLKVGRNNSFNTILCGVFLDKLEGEPTRFEQRRSTWLGAVKYEIDEQAPLKNKGATKTEDAQAAQGVWKSLNEKYGFVDSGSYQWAGRLLAYRALGHAGWEGFTPSQAQVMKGSTPINQALLKRWRWQTSLWTDEDRAGFDTTMTQGFQSLLKINPDLKRISY